MLEIIIILLVLLILLGFVDVSGIPDFALFTINGQLITLWNILTFLLIVWAISILPSPIRQIAGVLLILWILSILGIFAFIGLGLANLILIAIVIGLIASVFQSRSY